MDARGRKALGCSVLMVYLTLYSAAAATLGALLAPHIPQWAALLFYAIAGIVWVFPLRPMFRWINRAG